VKILKGAEPIGAYLAGIKKWVSVAGKHYHGTRGHNRSWLSVSSNLSVGVMRRRHSKHSITTGKGMDRSFAAGSTVSQGLRNTCQNMLYYRTSLIRLLYEYELLVIVKRVRTRTQNSKSSDADALFCTDSVEVLWPGFTIMSIAARIVTKSQHLDSWDVTNPYCIISGVGKGGWKVQVLPIV
jgi:hypothetical protein